MPEILIRGDLQGTPNEGAIEDGKPLTIIGRKLEVSEQMPRLLVWMDDPRIGVPGIISPRMFNPPEASYLLYGVNGYLTPKCAEEGIECQRLRALGLIPANVGLYGLTNEDLADPGVKTYRNANNIAHPFISSRYTSTAISLGAFIAEYGGDVQRFLIGVVDKTIVYSEYVFDQNKDFPNFGQAVVEIQKAT